VLRAADEDIAAVEAEIAKWKASSRERLKVRLADLFDEIEDGTICEKASKTVAKLEAKLRKSLEEEYEKKLAEATKKIAAELEEKLII
jgi:hypothetical protein